MTGDLQGQVALVTGSARGVGLAIGTALARASATVVLADLDGPAVAAAADRLAAAGATAVAAQLDVADVAAARRCVREQHARFGRLDILVNNAGICPLAEIEDVSEALWDRTLAVNLKGVFFVSQAATPIFKQQRSGRIVNVASISGKSGGAMPVTPYAASKAGVISLTKSFAAHLAPYQVNVNAVAPGPLDTDLTRAWSPESRERLVNAIPWHRFGTAEEVAAAVAFLAGPAASYITGATLDVNGGLRMD